MTGIPRKLRCYLPLFLLIVYLGAVSSQEQNSSSRQRWGPWTDWSSCSVSCGQGVAYRKRLCHNAESRTSCHGQDKQHKPCRHNCTANYKDYRTLQCEKYNGRYYGGKRYYWDALINPYNRCELACKARGPVKYYARFQETVPDGTPCKEDTQAVCIQGRCLDICNSRSQYCNEDEERCSPCTHEQCSVEAAKKILYQCAHKCKELFITTTETVSTTSESTGPVCDQGFSDPALILLTVILLLLIVGIIVKVLIYLRNNNYLSRSSDSLIERDNPNFSSQRLLYLNYPTDNQRIVVIPSEEHKHPIQINSHSDQSSTRVHNMVNDVNILKDATVGGHGATSMTASLHQDV